MYNSEKKINLLWILEIFNSIGWMDGWIAGEFIEFFCHVYFPRIGKMLIFIHSFRSSSIAQEPHTFHTLTPSSSHHITSVCRRHRNLLLQSIPNRRCCKLTVLWVEWMDGWIGNRKSIQISFPCIVYGWMKFAI